MRNVHSSSPFVGVGVQITTPKRDMVVADSKSVCPQLNVVSVGLKENRMQFFIVSIANWISRSKNGVQH